MKIIQDKKNKFIFKVESSQKGKFYNVNLKENNCNCPAYLFRAKRLGADCKHLIAVKEKYKKDNKGNSEKKILDFVKKKGEVDSVELIEMFNEEEVNKLLDEGALIEVKGKIRVLE